MWLLIEPTDVWMFRDGKPFSAGDSHTAQSLFPPTAFVVQGMLRTLLMMRRGDDFAAKQTNELITDLGGFQMRGPYLARRDRSVRQWERVFPLPADVSLHNKHDYRVLAPSAQVLNAANSDYQCDLQMLTVTRDDEEPETPYWVSESAFNTRYLSEGQLSRTDCIPEEDLFVREFRFGNALNYEQRAVRSDEGMLYAAGFVRLHTDVGLLVELPDTSLLREVFQNEGDSEYFRFGGEGRSARIQYLSEEQILKPLLPEMREEGGFKIVFITPTYFSGGVASDSSELSALFGVCIGAAIKRPLALGGWDLAARRPRSILRYVAPGSVYYCKGERPEKGLLLTDQPQNSYSLYDLGFGESMIGNWS
jgi:CRISPR-associated protein Cmr3